MQANIKGLLRTIKVLIFLDSKGYNEYYWILLEIEVAEPGPERICTRSTVSEDCWHVSLPNGSSRLVFLEYLPGGGAPTQALVRLDGSSASIPFEKLLKGVCLDNETVWSDFNECNASFESLACWGHHFMGLPWER